MTKIIEDVCPGLEGVCFHLLIRPSYVPACASTHTHERTETKSIQVAQQARERAHKDMHALTIKRECTCMHSASRASDFYPCAHKGTPQTSDREDGVFESSNLPTQNVHTHTLFNNPSPVCSRLRLNRSTSFQRRFAGPAS